MTFPWILIGIGAVIILLLVFVLVYSKKSEKKPETDYFTFFVMGICWLGAGIPLGISSNNWALFFMGIVFMVLGLANKDKWKKNHKTWSKLSKREKKTKTWLLISGILILLLGIVAFFLVIR